MRARILRSFAILLFVGAAVVPAGERPVAAPEARTGKIAFASDVDGDFEIFVMRADGSRVRQLTDNDVDDFEPSWSPSGRRIVFEQERGENGYEDLYIVGVRSGVVRPWVLTRGIDEGEPDWSPDGRWIAFRGNDVGDGADVVAVTLDRKRGRIVSAQSENSTNSDPAWSPDGSRLALLESYEGSDLFVASFCCSHGYRKSHVTGSGWWMHDVGWSPDGTCIAYTRDATGSSEIYTVLAGGGEPRLIHTAAPSGAFGSWSPDGSEIVFHSAVAGSNDLYAMEADGGDVRRLTETTDVDEITPAWWAPPVEEPATPECGATAGPSPLPPRALLRRRQQPS